MLVAECRVIRVGAVIRGKRPLGHGKAFRAWVEAGWPPGPTWRGKPAPDGGQPVVDDLHSRGQGSVHLPAASWQEGRRTLPTTGCPSQELGSWARLARCVWEADPGMPSAGFPRRRAVNWPDTARRSRMSGHEEGGPGGHQPGGHLPPPPLCLHPNTIRGTVPSCTTSGGTWPSV